MIWFGLGLRGPDLGLGLDNCLKIKLTLCNVHYQQLVKQKADKSHNCDEDTERGEEVDACDLVDTCEKQAGHNHPGVGHTQHSWLT